MSIIIEHAKNADQGLKVKGSKEKEYKVKKILTNQVHRGKSCCLCNGRFNVKEIAYKHGKGQFKADDTSYVCGACINLIRG
mgnify:CR=1 FL=1